MILTTLKGLLKYWKELILIPVLVFLVFLVYHKHKQLTAAQQELATYKRQVDGQLTQKEQQLEDANSSLGIAKSQFLQEQDLVKALQEDGIKTSAALEAYEKKYDLEVDSASKTIAILQEQLKGKSTTTITDPTTPPTHDPQFSHLIDPSKDVLSYKWNSGDGRFALTDDNIFNSNSNKTFKLSQSFRITAQVLREKAGFLKTEALTMEEVVEDGKNADGSVKYKVVGDAKVVDSEFKYSERPPTDLHAKKGMFGLWGTISGNLGLINGTQPHFLLGTGLNFIQWQGLGLGVNLYLDTKTYQTSSFGIAATYRPTIKGTELNFALNAGIATEFIAPFATYTPILGVSFFAW